ncbi:MAG: D-glucuronyl C5-epimerase family protein [Solirubrobacteraceae bacterium]|nr:D-glucuronyl C5-epimerase family protein [Solirubrobacteraceae bacterium]
MSPRASVLALAAATLALAGAAPVSASPRVLLVDGSSVRSTPANGAELAGADASPADAAGLLGSAARVQTTDKKKTSKKKAKKPPYDLTVIRKAINKAGGVPARAYDARAALTSADRVMRAAKKDSQAKRELEGLFKYVTVMARGNRITADRMLMLTETLRRNAEWWKLGRATGNGQRVQFDGSQMIWQLYTGSGIQLQWLGTFGRGNSLFYSGAAHVAELSALVDEAIKLAVPRAGGISWEYFFPFGGGNPPWVSGMAEATGIQVLARASGPTKMNRPALLETAKSAMGILRTPPPTGVQVVEDTGTHFLIYSFSAAKVLNAMNQTVNGLYAYVLANPTDVDARLTLLDGLRWLDTNVGRYDTGSWTLYQLGGAKADTHYHGVARDFLKTLCSLLHADAKTPGGGPTGAYPSANICAAAATWTKYSAK